MMFIFKKKDWLEREVVKRNEVSRETKEKWRLVYRTGVFALYIPRRGRYMLHVDSLLTEAKVTFLPIHQLNIPPPTSPSALQLPSDVTSTHTASMLREEGPVTKVTWIYRRKYRQVEEGELLMTIWKVGDSLSTICRQMSLSGYFCHIQTLLSANFLLKGIVKWQGRRVVSGINRIIMTSHTIADVF